MKLKRVISYAAASATLLAAHAVLAGPIQISGAFNFREVSGGNAPLNFRTGDHLLIGATVVDADTNLRPDGTIAKVRNTATNEVFDLRPDGTRGVFNRIEYTPQRAAGDFVLEVFTNTETASALLPAFGTGASSQPLPPVQNLTTIGTGANRTLTWDPLVNNGHVDRLRVRLNDSQGQLLDLRGLGIGNTPSLGATSFAFDSSQITHNGLYTARIMSEGFSPFNRTSEYTTFVVDDLQGLGGTAETFTSAFAFRDRLQDNSIGWTPGDRLSLGVQADGFDGTFMHAENDGQFVTLPRSREADRSFEFSTSVAFDPTLTDPWTVTAFNGSQKSTVQTQAFNAANPLPFVRNILMTPNDLTPTISWELPVDNTVPFDNVQIGLFDDSTNERLSVFGASGDQLFETLSPSATSFTFAPGQLQFGKQYVARVILRDLENDSTVNRSVSFFNFSPIAGQDAPVVLPTLDENGVFNFDFDVQAATPVRLDPFVAVGYDYTVGANDPLFATVSLPDIGDGIYDLFLFDAAGNPFDSGLDLFANNVFDFRSLGTLAGVDYSAGAGRFSIRGIEVAAGLDPTDVSAFVTTVTFATTGTFTGSMTPLTVFVNPPQASEPAILALLLGGFAGVAVASRRRKRQGN